MNDSNTNGATILYAGDTLLQGPACYLAGVMARHGLSFDYLASDQPIGPKLQGSNYSLYIISDYPATNLAPKDYDIILQAVRDGAGLLMIGGWESFHGLAGEYHNSPLTEALPVTMADSDDRVNSPQPYIPIKRIEHPIVDGLPWDCPPGIGGFNRIATKPEATELLTATQLLLSTDAAGQVSTSQGESIPLLVVGQYGEGRTAALATDVAPHWVGTLVDWGDSRVTAHAPGSEEIEVGNHYVQFLEQLLDWMIG